MKCPSCKHEFGYLHIEGTKEELNVEFNCPNCSELLNANPIINAMKKSKFFLNIGLSAGAIILALGYWFYGDNLPSWLGGTFVLTCSACIGLSYLEHKKVDSGLSYEKALSKNGS